MYQKIFKGEYQVPLGSSTTIVASLPAYSLSTRLSEHLLRRSCACMPLAAVVDKLEAVG
jgi:hypothetical protein